MRIRPGGGALRVGRRGRVREGGGFVRRVGGRGGGLEGFGRAAEITTSSRASPALTDGGI